MNFKLIALLLGSFLLPLCSAIGAWEVKELLTTLFDAIKSEISMFEKRMRDEIRSSEERMRDEIKSSEERMRDGIRSSEERMRDGIRSSEERIRDGIRSFEEKTRNELKAIRDLILDESPLFVKKFVSIVKPCTYTVEGASAFGVLFKGQMFLITAGHMGSKEVLNHPTHVDLNLVHPRMWSHNVGTMTFLNTDDFIADPAIGDNIFALGYDPIMNLTARLWTGSVLSVWDETLAMVDTTGQTKVGVRTWLFTGETTDLGMPGAPVFNGCGLVGVSVATKVHTLDTFQVMHVRHLLEFLDHPEAKEYGFTVDDPMQVRTCPIKVKSYC